MTWKVLFHSAAGASAFRSVERRREEPDMWEHFDCDIADAFGEENTRQRIDAYFAPYTKGLDGQFNPEIRGVAASFDVM